MSNAPSPVAAAIAAVLRPLARLAVARGVGYGPLQRLLKAAMVAAAREAEPQASQSRLSLMSGVHRKDVRALLADGEDGMAAPAVPRPSLVQTVMARWLARADDGADPPPLPRDGPDGFDALVAGISRDVRPRAVLDEMIRLGLVVAVPDEPGGGPARLRLTAEAWVPGREDADAEALDLFAGNVGDHAAAATANLTAAPDEPRRLERAVFHTHLSPESVAELEAEGRRLGMAALRALNRRALDLQRRDMAAGTARRRFRYGVYFHEAPMATGAAADAGPSDGAGAGGEADGEGDRQR